MSRTITGILGFLVLALAVLGGCAPQVLPEEDLATLEVDDTLTPASGEALDFQEAYMKTFAIENSAGMAARGVRALLPVDASATPKATWPSDTVIRLFTQAMGSLSNYPEVGVTTSYLLEAAPAVGANVYLATVTSTYPADSIMDVYVESYYVKDRSIGTDTPDGWWTKADPIVDATGAADPTARQTMEIHFRDGSIRYETIVEFILPEISGTGFAAFDVTGPLSFPEFAYPAEDANAVFSSIIVYQQTRPTTHDFTFWQGLEEQTLVGVRYYTEHYVDGDTQYKGTTAAYEKAISTLDTLGGSFVGSLATVFVGSEHAVLAESVFRKEVLFNVVDGAVDPSAVGQNSIMRTHVVDITDQADFQLQLLNEDVTRLLAWEGETYAIPDGEVAEILATDPVAEVLRKETLVNPDGTEVSTLEPGSTDIADLYTSISVGYASLGVNGGAGNDVGTDDTLDGDGEVLGFSGEMGQPFEDNLAWANAGDAGTVEAWVYINVHSNWGGIVHKGELADFSDEGWSLQFVSNRGDVAFAVVSQSPYGYEMAQSTIRLNTGRWYYLVGTWDNSKIKLYINGALNKQVNSTRNSYISAARIVVGSQLLEGQTMQDWYGFNGKINGVRVFDTAKDLAYVQAEYNTYKDVTINW